MNESLPSGHLEIPLMESWGGLITLGEPMFRNKEYASQLKDYSGLKFGNISPTDIDACLEFGGKLFIFVETKFGNSPMPRGQELALERLCDLLTVPAVIIQTTHNSSGDIDMANTIVTRYRENTNWFTEVPEITLREMIELMRRKYLG